MYDFQLHAEPGHNWRRSRATDIDPDKSAAALQNIKLVNVDWLLDSLGKKRRQDESAYLIYPSAAPPAAAAASPPSPPPGSPPKTRPSRTKRALDSQTNGTPASDAKDGPPAKKQKDDSGKSAAKNKDTTAVKQQTPEKKEAKIKVPVDNEAYASGMASLSLVYPPVFSRLCVPQGL